MAEKTGVIERVDGQPGGHPGAHLGVDLLCTERTVGGQGGPGNDGNGSSGVGVVAFEAHPAELVAETELEDDLGCRGQQ